MTVEEFLEFADEVRQSLREGDITEESNVRFSDGDNHWDIRKLSITCFNEKTEEDGSVDFELELTE